MTPDISIKHSQPPSVYSRARLSHVHFLEYLNVIAGIPEDMQIEQKPIAAVRTQYKQ